LIQPTCEQARRSSLFPTFDVEGAPFDGVLLRRFHAHTNSRRAGRRAATFTRAAPGRFPTWGVAPDGPPSSSAHRGRVPPIYEGPARVKARPGRASGVQRAAAFTTIRVGWTVIYPDASSMMSRGPRRLNQNGRPSEGGYDGTRARLDHVVRAVHAGTGQEDAPPERATRAHVAADRQVKGSG
jgi:hypothetical protein